MYFYSAFEFRPNRPSYVVLLFMVVNGNGSSGSGRGWRLDGVGSG